MSFEQQLEHVDANVIVVNNNPVASGVLDLSHDTANDNVNEIRRESCEEDQTNRNNIIPSTESVQQSSGTEFTYYDPNYAHYNQYGSYSNQDYQQWYKWVQLFGTYAYDVTNS